MGTQSSSGLWEAQCDLQMLEMGTIVLIRVMGVLSGLSFQSMLSCVLAETAAISPQVGRENIYHCHHHHHCHHHLHHHIITIIICISFKDDVDENDSN